MTVTLTFTKPWSEMPTALVEQTGYVIAPEQVKSGSTDHPIGTGPFEYKEWVPDNHFTAVKNPNYWRAGEPYLDSIEFRPIPDPTLRLNALKSGDIDVAETGSIGQSKLDEMAAAGFTVDDDVDNVGVVNLLMNNDSPTVKDKRVREAIVAAIDRDAFRNAVLDSSYETADQPYPEDNKWHTDVDYPGYDPDHARQLVDDYEAENGPIKISIMIDHVGRANRTRSVHPATARAGGHGRLDRRRRAGDVRPAVRRVVSTTRCTWAASSGPPIPMVRTPSSPRRARTPTRSSSSTSPATATPRWIKRCRRNVRPTTTTAREAQWAKIWNAFADDLPYAFLAYDTHGLGDEDRRLRPD